MSTLVANIRAAYTQVETIGMLISDDAPNLSRLRYSVDAAKAALLRAHELADGEEA